MNEPIDSAADYLRAKPVLTNAQGLALSIAAALVLGLLSLIPIRNAPIQRLEDVSIDWRFRVRGPRRPPRDIVIVEIDEESRRALNEGGRRFDLRRHLAPAIDNLAEAGAVATGVDVWLTGKGDDETDALLARMIAGTNVVLAAVQAGGLQRADKVFLAAEPLEGVISVNPDFGVLRRLPPTLYVDVPGADGTLAQGRRLLHFPLALSWLRALEADESLRPQIEDGVVRIGGYHASPSELIDFASLQVDRLDSEHGWRSLQFADVVENRFNADDVDGCIVLIGEAGILRDSFVMPFSGEWTPGVFYHANAVAHIIEGRHFDDAWCAGWRRRVLVSSLVFAAALFAWNQRQWWRYRRGAWYLSAYVLGGLLLFLGGWMLWVFAAFDRNVLLPLVQPSLGMIVALASGLAAQWLLMSESARRLDARSRRIEALFGQSVSHQVLDALKREPERIMRTEVREISVLFCDLRSFTATTSELTPLETAALLNEFFDFVTEAVFEHDGFVDKFVGDEIMAVFGVPFEQEDHASRAVLAALRIKERMQALNAVRSRRGEAALNCGIGIHSGKAAAGHIGSRDRSNYTVVGTTVNLAARIEQFTKRGEILISEAVKERLPVHFAVKNWDRVQVRGATGEYDLYEVESLPE